MRRARSRAGPLAAASREAVNFATLNRFPRIVKEFVYTAFDASATHPYVPGLKQHIANALGTPILVEELRRRQQPG